MDEAKKAEYAAEMKKNMAAYDAMPADWVAKHRGKVALFANGALVDIYDTMGDAYRTGCRLYGLGYFGLKEIGRPPINLGIFSTYLNFRDGKDEAPCPAMKG